MSTKLAILVVLVTIGVCGVEAHKCIHGSTEIQKMMQESQTKKLRVETRGFGTASMEPIRVGFSSANLVASQYCASTSDSAKPDFKGGTLPCTSADETISAAKVSYITNNIMPAAIEIIQQSLSVNRLTTPLKPSPSSCGSQYIVPSDDSTNGIPNTDFYIYVSAGPVGNRDTLAFASACETDSGTGRPLVGRINFNPYFLTWDDLNPSRNNDNLIRTAIHEISHALGFSNNFFTTNNRSSTITGTRGKPDVTVIHTDNVREVAKKYFGCDTIAGVEIEDEGAAGSKGSHWDRRILLNELMTAQGGDVRSVFTLAYFKDLGYYDANYSMAEDLIVGKGLGCPFIDSKCNTDGGGKGPVWCFDNPSEGDKKCTANHKAIGICNSYKYSTSLASYFQFYSDPTVGGAEYADMCPYVEGYGNRICNFARSSMSEAESALGYYFGEGGRCFDTDQLHKSGNSATDGLRCLKARCPYNGTRIELQVDGVWRVCPLDGAAGTAPPPVGWEGAVTCPAALGWCDKENSYGSNERESKPSGNVELPENTGTATVTGELILNGSSWAPLLEIDQYRVDLYNSIRIDVGRMLAVGSASVRVRRLFLDGQMSILVGLIDDGTHGLDDTAMQTALATYINNAEAVPNTRDAYSKAQVGATSPDSKQPVIRAIYVDRKESSSICSDSISPDRCIMIIGIVVTIVCAIVIAILMYCLCFRSPFEAPPEPPVKGKARRSSRHHDSRTPA